MPLAASMAAPHSPVAQTYSHFLLNEEEGSPLFIFDLQVRRVPTWNPNTTNLNQEPNTDNFNQEPQHRQLQSRTQHRLQPRIPTDNLNLKPNTDNFNPGSNTSSQLQPRTLTQPASFNPELQHSQPKLRIPTQATHSEKVQKGYLETAWVCLARDLGFRAASVGAPETAEKVFSVGRGDYGKSWPGLRAELRRSLGPCRRQEPPSCHRFSVIIGAFSAIPHHSLLL